MERFAVYRRLSTDRGHIYIYIYIYIYRYKQQNADSGIAVDCCSVVHVHGWLEFPRWKHVTTLETFPRVNYS